MKRQFLIYAFIFGFYLLFVNSTYAQIIKGEAIAGFNISQVDGDEIYGFHKIGANVGAGVLIPFSKNGKWDLSVEALYTQQGSYQGRQYSDSIITGEYKVNLNYVQVPALVMFTDKELISFGAGFAWGRLVGVKEWEHGVQIDSTNLNSGTYNKNDFSIFADIRIRLYKGLKFNLRYAYSLAKIRTREYENLNGDTWTRDQYNNVLSFRLIYVFNEEKSRQYFRNAQQ